MITVKREEIPGSNFTRTENPTIMDGRVIRYREKGGNENTKNLEISASRNGVMLQGYSFCITSEERLSDYIKTMRKAFREYQWMVGGTPEPESPE